MGSLTTPAPPNHMAQCNQAMGIDDGPEHLAFLHDAAAQRVVVLQGLEGQALRLTFDGSYAGSYDVSSADITLGNNLDCGGHHGRGAVSAAA